jgi:hypothetical protein
VTYCRRLDGRSSCSISIRCTVRGHGRTGRR